MKKYLVICICLFVFSCQKEGGDVELDWKQEIDNTILKYSSLLSIESVKLYKESGKKGKIIYYKKNEKGFYKITNEITHEKTYRYFQVIYFLGDRVIKTELEILKPFVPEKKKEISDPNYVLSKNSIYFRTENSAFKKSKEFNLSDFNDFIIKRKELIFSDYKQEWVKNANEEYNKVLKIIEKFKII